MRTAEAVRTVSGSVGSGGAIGVGSADFSVTRQSAGVYVIRFREPFGRLPGVVAVSQNQYLVAYSTVDAAQATLVFSTTVGGAGVDTSFLFVASGPQGRAL